MTSSGHVFHEMFFHINWHCHRDDPYIKPSIETILFKFIKGYCRKLKGVYFKGIGGTETHLHLLVQVEPFVSLSEIIGKIKGASAREVNSMAKRIVLRWQRGYGIVTFAKKNLPALINYVNCQKEHHSEGTVRHLLELTE